MPKKIRVRLDAKRLAKTAAKHLPKYVKRRRPRLVDVPEPEVVLKRKPKRPMFADGSTTCAVCNRVIWPEHAHPETGACVHCHSTAVERATILDAAREAMETAADRFVMLWIAHPRDDDAVGRAHEALIREVLVLRTYRHSGAK